MWTMKRNGDSAHPCRSPTPTVNGRDLAFPTWSQAYEQKYSDLTASHRRPSTPTPAALPKAFHKQPGYMLSRGRQTMLRYLWHTPKISQNFAGGWNVICSAQWRIQTMHLGGSQKCLHLLKYQRLSAKKEVIFCKSKSGYFCWSNYAIFQGITTVWKRFISLIQKTFETGSKQWDSFFATYGDLVYLQNVFKRYKSMLRASVCHCFGYP